MNQPRKPTAQRTLAEQLQNKYPDRAPAPRNNNGGYNKNKTRNERQNVRNWNEGYGITLRTLQRLGNDGEDHINVHRDPQTELGYMMSMNHDIQFKHPIFGPFKTVAGMWYWFRTEDHDESFRHMLGGKVFYTAKFKKLIPFPRDFKYYIAQANWEKTKASKKLQDWIVGTNLPFDYYSYDMEDTIRVRPPEAIWMIAAWEEIRDALRQNREPNFEDFKDPRQPGEVEEVVEPIYQTFTPPKRGIFNPKKAENINQPTSKQPRNKQPQPSPVVENMKAVDSEAVQLHDQFTDTDISPVENMKAVDTEQETPKDPTTEAIRALIDQRIDEQGENTQAPTEDETQAQPEVESQ